MKKTFLLLLVIISCSQLFSQNYIGENWNGKYKGTGILTNFNCNKNFNVPVSIDVYSKDNIVVMNIVNPDYKNATNTFGIEDYFVFLFMNNVNNSSRAEHITELMKIIVSRRGNKLSGTAKLFNMFNGKPDLKLTFSVYKKSNQSTYTKETNKSTYYNRTRLFTDSRDGKTYKTVKIGQQVWMAKNLSYKVSSGCWAYANKQSNVAKYGYLYNWETAKKVCPNGWHLPTDNELTELTNYLGGEKKAGKKLKSETAWKLYYGQNRGDNSSGFSAYPSGTYKYGEGFIEVGKAYVLWSSTEYSGTDAWIFGTYYTSTIAKLFKGAKTHGFSVRCLENSAK